MDTAVKACIDRVKADCLAGRRQDRQTIIDLLAICPGSEEYRYLCQAAREAAAVITGGEAYLWGAIGVDFAPCPMNCRFCSLGESWGIVRDEVSYSEDEIISPVSYTHLDVYKRQTLYSAISFRSSQLSSTEASIYVQAAHCSGSSRKHSMRTLSMFL